MKSPGSDQKEDDANVGVRVQTEALEQKNEQEQQRADRDERGASGGDRVPREARDYRLRTPFAVAGPSEENG